MTSHVVIITVEQRRKGFTLPSMIFGAVQRRTVEKLNSFDAHWLRSVRLLVVQWVRCALRSKKL
jgi:hypothetical protein